MMLLLWLHILRLVVASTTDNSLFRSLSVHDLCQLQGIQNSLARIITNTTKYLHITPVRKTLRWLPIEHGSLRLPCGCTSSYKVVILNILNFFLNLDKVCPIYTEVKLVMCCSRSHTLSHQYISLQCILASTLHSHELQRFQPTLSTHSQKVQNLSLCKSIPTLVSCYILVFLHGISTHYIQLYDLWFSVSCA